MTDTESWADEAVDTDEGRQVATTPPTISYINESGVPDEMILADRRLNQEIASIIEQWTQSLSPTRPTGGIDVFARERWANARHPFAIMSQCAWAVENDDILSTLADVTEGLAFKKMRFELNDDDQQDMWNQWARDVDLDSQLRTMWRDLFKVSQFYVGLWWEPRIYKVRDNPLSATLAQLMADALPDPNDPNAPPADPNVPDIPNFTPPPRKSPGRGNRKRKKQFAVEIPTALTVFDPTKIMPVGQLMFGRERFAYIADPNEDQSFASALRGEVIDATVMQLVERKYDPTPADKIACGLVGVDNTRLWLLKQGSVYRHTLTRSQYERFAPVRLKTVLEILDLKKHQRAADRATLIGNTNFIVVITKGTDKLPAKAAEIENLRDQARMVARLPVLVGDHRLHVDIVAPTMDHTLEESRWQILDSRLAFVALGSFQPSSQGSGRSSTGITEMGRVVSQGIENRRHMLVRSLERALFREVMARNEAVLDEEPNLAFAPKRVTLDFNVDIMQAILKLRDRGDVSRESTLDEFDYDQDAEVVRRAREKATYDKVFLSGTPFSSPETNPFGAQPAGAAPAAAPDKPAAGPEGGRPPGVKEKQPRKPAGQTS